jgi:hypothetical protein
MGCIDYADAVNGALQRLHTTGSTSAIPSPTTRRWLPRR